MAGWDRGRDFEDDDFGGFLDPYDSSDEGFSDQSEAVLQAHRDLPPKQRWQRAAIDGNLQELKKAKEGYLTYTYISSETLHFLIACFILQTASSMSTYPWTEAGPPSCTLPHFLSRKSLDI